MLKALFAGVALVTIGYGGAATAAPFNPAPEAPARIILVRGGCGPAFHRGPLGACVPNRRVVVGVAPVVVGAPAVVAPIRLPPPCPRGYHRDPDPARPICYPNF